MGQTVLSGLDSYPAEILQGSMGAEMVGVIDNIAMRQLMLKRYREAEKSYQKALGLHEGLTSLDSRTKSIGKAGIYHQLGMVAEEQRHWAQAEEYYQKALQIKIEFSDRYSQANTYHNLGRMAQEQRQWEIARECLLKSLEIVVEFNDKQGAAIALSSLARLWQSTADQRVLAGVGQLLGISQADAKKLLEGEG